MFAKIFKRIEFWIFFLIALGLILMFSKQAYASINSEPWYSHLTPTGLWMGAMDNENGTGMNTISRITNSSETICAITPSLTIFGSPTDNLLINLYEGAPPTTLLGTITIPYSSVASYNGTVRADFPDCYTLDSSKTYYLSFSRSGAFSDTNYYGVEYSNSGASTDNTLGTLYHANHEYYPWMTAGFGVAAVNEALYGGSAAPPPTTITFTYPNATTTPFDDWKLTLENATSTGFLTSIHYSRISSSSEELAWNTTSTTVYFDSHYDTKASSTTPFEISVWQLASDLWYPPLSIPIRWYAQAFVFDSPTNVIASSSIITFDFYPTTGAPPTATTTISEAEIACTSGNFFTNSLCDILQFLFYPSDNVLSKYTGIKDELSTKPPFGYFSAITSALSGINTSTTPAFSLPIVNFAPLIALRLGITMILWLAFSFWLLHRIRHLNI